MQFVLYEFVLVNLYTKISEKKICIRVGISTPDQYLRLKSSLSAIHHPTSSISAHFIYIPYNKITIRKSGLYDFTRMAYSQPLLGWIAAWMKKESSAEKLHAAAFVYSYTSPRFYLLKGPDRRDH